MIPQDHSWMRQYGGSSRLSRYTPCFFCSARRLIHGSTLPPTKHGAPSLRQDQGKREGNTVGQLYCRCGLPVANWLPILRPAQLAMKPVLMLVRVRPSVKGAFTGRAMPPV